MRSMVEIGLLGNLAGFAKPPSQPRLEFRYLDIQNLMLGQWENQKFTLLMIFLCIQGYIVLKGADIDSC